MKVNTIVGILLTFASLYAKSAVAGEEHLNHLRRLAPPSCGDGKVSGKEDCDPPDNITCDANCKSITGPSCDLIRCTSACFQKDDGPEVNCVVGTTCKLCDENELGCTSNDCTLEDGTVCFEQSFKCAPCIDPMTGVCECATVACLVDPCTTAKCGSGEVCKSNYCGGCNAVCEPNVSTTAATKPVATTVPINEGCIDNDEQCSGNCSGCCSNKSINLGGGLKKCVAE